MNSVGKKRSANRVAKSGRSGFGRATDSRWDYAGEDSTSPVTSPDEHHGRAGARRRPSGWAKLTARIALVDDHPIVREILRQRIEAEDGFKVVAEAQGRVEALYLAENQALDLVIVSLRLGTPWGVDLIEDLRAQTPGTVVLAVSMFGSFLHAASALRAGARGFMTQDEAARSLSHAIRRTLSGEIYLSSALSQAAAAKLVRTRKSGSALGVDALSKRELQIFELVGFGLDSRQIARSTGLDISTVDTYRARIKDKLQFTNASDFLQGAIAWVHSKSSSVARPELDGLS